MKRLMFSLLVLLMASFVGVNAQVINNEVQFKGSATNVYMGGKHVRDMNDLTFSRLLLRRTADVALVDMPPFLQQESPIMTWTLHLKK